MMKVICLLIIILSACNQKQEGRYREFSRILEENMQTFEKIIDLLTDEGRIERIEIIKGEIRVNPIRNKFPRQKPDGTYSYCTDGSISLEFVDQDILNRHQNLEEIIELALKLQIRKIDYGIGIIWFELEAGRKSLFGILYLHDPSEYVKTKIQKEGRYGSFETKPIGKLKKWFLYKD
ncbi:MAG: hypothetical protein CR997_09610 [Acidobacteria bacterium]|nr:MAG: hypothetical protein CR997_09610 [Acidobacteriota bacterium]